MNREDLLNEYGKLINEKNLQYASVATLIDRWLNGEAAYNSDELQKIVDKELLEIEKKKNIADLYLKEYNKLSFISANKKHAVYRSGLDEEEEARKQRRFQEIKDAILSKKLDVSQAEVIKNNLNRDDDIKKVSSL